MNIYPYAQARQHLDKLLDEARSQDTLIRRRGGEMFRISSQRPACSPFDIEGITTRAITADILRAVRDSRRR